MDREMLYLKKRANFHARMAQQATCGEARCAHQAFIRAYLDRIERRTSLSRPEPDHRSRASARPAAPIAAAPGSIR